MENIMNEDFREVGRRDAEKLVNRLESLGTAPLDLVEYAYGLYEYICEYLGFVPQEEGSTEALEGIGSYEIGKDNMTNRVMLIQLADGLVREFSEDFPFAYMDEAGPAPLLYWFREGVPSGGMDWDWLALYCYEGIAEAYKYIRETWLPNLPDLFEN